MLRWHVMKKINGFTLVELLVTMAVLAIIVTMAIPAFGDMIAKQNLKKSAQELIVIINKARAKAVLERRVVTVNLTPLANINDTENVLNWRPSGNSILMTGSNSSILFGITGGVFVSGSGTPASFVPATVDTTFTICSASSGTNKKSKTITVTRMGTIQMTTEGTC